MKSLLDEREKRWQTKRYLATTFKAPVLTLVMNIPGREKNLPGVRKAFSWLQQTLRVHLGLVPVAQPIPITPETASFVSLMPSPTPVAALYEEEYTGAEGPCWHVVLPLEAHALKRLVLQVEEGHPLGRLADADVTTPTGEPLSRHTLSLPPRPCFLCHEPAVLCRRNQKHAPEELLAHVKKLLHAPKHPLSPERIGALAVQAAIHEAAATPKPGLVCVNTNGAHTDMTFATLVASAVALHPYFTQAAQIGSTCSLATEASIFPALRALGKQAEHTMFAATCGINTHKGLVFSLGLLCAAAGRFAAQHKRMHTGDLCACAANFIPGLVAADFAAIAPFARHNATTEKRTSTTQKSIEKLLGHPLTAGEILYLRHGITGIRGEAEAGFLHVQQALATLYEELKLTSLNDALINTLLKLMSMVEDTNLLWRGGKTVLHSVQKKAALALKSQGMRSPKGQQHIEDLQTFCLKEHASPGGSADLLAATLFIYFLQQESS